MGCMNLGKLALGSSARIESVGGEGALRQHLLDMGLIPGMTLTAVKHAPMGDPLEVEVSGYRLTLRMADAAKIEVVELADGEAEACEVRPVAAPASALERPGLGEGGRFHVDEGRSPLPENQITIALVGNQNSGKTTLFNQLTGANQHVGNFPGVTVERKSGKIRGHEATIVDLPGIYSLSPYSAEEVVSRDLIMSGEATAVINIVDATNIERNLYLTMQLLELGVPMVIALNMMDEVSANGGSVRVNELEALLGAPVVPISALKGAGIDELVGHALHVAAYCEPPDRQDFCDKEDHGGALHRCLHSVIHLIEDHAEAASIPLRFAASKLVEGDELVRKSLGLEGAELETIERIVSHMEDEVGLDRAAAIAEMRFSFVRRVCAQTVVVPRESRERIRSSRMDEVLTGTYTAIPAFIAVMGLVFWLTFHVIGPALQDLLASGVDALAAQADVLLARGGASEAARSLVAEGIFGGVGSVLSFAPIIVTLYLFLSILEDSGYLARVAFVVDKILRRLGLSGRSIVPMLIGFGCSVPAVMATRTLPSERDRKMTILLIPFMSCSAKLPIYTFLATIFFPAHAALVTVCLYVLGIIVAIVVALVAKRTAFKGEPVPFVMELPDYRMPSPQNVARLLWAKTADFIHRAFTVILVATVVVWFLQHFDFGFSFIDDPADSILAAISGAIAPVLAPLGLGDWRIATALVTGFLAKEGVVAMLSMLYGGTAAIAAVLTPAAALALLVFCLIYTPCVAAIAAVKRELGRGWAIGIVVEQCAVAWVAAFLVHLVAQAFL